MAVFVELLMVLATPLLLLLMWLMLVVDCVTTGLELALLFVFDGGPKSLGEMLIERTSRFLALPAIDTNKTIMNCVI